MVSYKRYICVFSAYLIQNPHAISTLRKLLFYAIIPPASTRCEEISSATRDGRQNSQPLFSAKTHFSGVRVQQINQSTPLMYLGVCELYDDRQNRSLNLSFKVFRSTITLLDSVSVTCSWSSCLRASGFLDTTGIPHIYAVRFYPLAHYTKGAFSNEMYLLTCMLSLLLY